MCGKALHVDITCKLSTQCFIPAALMGAIDLYHFISLLATLTFLRGGGGGGVARSAESRTCWLQFLTHCSNERDEILEGYEEFILKS